MSWKKSLFLTCQILGLLVNTLAADEKYPALNRDNLTIPIQMQLSQKPNTFPEFFAAFFKFLLNFKYFEKKIPLIDFVFPKLQNLKTLSDQRLKCLVSDDHSTSNMVNVPKHCPNLGTTC